MIGYALPHLFAFFNIHRYKIVSINRVKVPDNIRGQWLAFKEAENDDTTGKIFIVEDDLRVSPVAPTCTSCFIVL